MFVDNIQLSGNGDRFKDSVKFIINVLLNSNLDFNLRVEPDLKMFSFSIDQTVAMKDMKLIVGTLNRGYSNKFIGYTTMTYDISGTDRVCGFDIDGSDDLVSRVERSTDGLDDDIAEYMSR